MPGLPPDVRKLIDEFAERLCALAGGEQIHDEWSLYLAERLAPTPKRRPRGRPLDLDCLEAVAYEITKRHFESNPIVAKTSPKKRDKERSRSALSEQEKRRISDKYDCSVRTINNMQRIHDAVFPKHHEEPEDPARSPSVEEHNAVFQGTVRALGERLKWKDAEELRRRKERGS